MLFRIYTLNTTSAFRKENYGQNILVNLLQFAKSPRFSSSRILYRTVKDVNWILLEAVYDYITCATCLVNNAYEIHEFLKVWKIKLQKYLICDILEIYVPWKFVCVWYSKAAIIWGWHFNFYYTAYLSTYHAIVFTLFSTAIVWFTKTWISWFVVCINWNEPEWGPS